MSNITELNKQMKTIDKILDDKLKLYQQMLGAYVICDMTRHSKRYPNHEYTFVSAMGAWGCSRPRPGFEGRIFDVYATEQVNLPCVQKFQSIYDEYGDFAYSIFPVMKVTAKAGKVKIQKDW